MRVRPLDPIEIRVLGALMEKEQTTPDAYPLTINGVISACNQKSNRDPVMSLGETEVVEALDRLREEVLTWRSEGARTERWEHRLERRLGLDEAKKAVLCLLFLRGPQTPGELKTRSDRLHHFADRSEVEATLATLAEEFDPLVEELPRAPGQRENRWCHRLLAEEYAPEETPPEAIPAARPAVVVAPREVAAAAGSPAAGPPAAGPPAAESSAVVEQLVSRLDHLEGRIAEVEHELRTLRQRLGDV